MKNYSIAVTTTETTETIQPSKYLILTAGAVDVQVKLQKTPMRQPQADTGDFRTLRAMTTTRIYTRKGAFWAVTHKTATGTSTLAAFASNNEVVPENRAWWMQGTLKQISVPATAGNILTVLSPTVGRQAPIYNADGTPTANSFGF